MATSNGSLTGGERRASSNPAAVAIPVVGFDLGGCGAEQAERALRSAPGVLYVYVNRATETAYVRYDPDRIGPHGLRLGSRRSACERDSRERGAEDRRAAGRVRDGPPPRIRIGSSRLLHNFFTGKR